MSVMLTVGSAIGAMLITVYSTAWASRASFDTSVWNFGAVAEGEGLAHEFVLTNDGSDTLEISRVSTSCGCAVAEPAAKRLRPGETTVIKAKIRTAGFAGEQPKYIRVFTNDRGNAVKQLTLTGRIISPFLIEPLRPVLVPGETLTITVRTNREYEAVDTATRVKGIEEVSPEQTAVKIRETATSEWQLDVWLPPHRSVPAWGFVVVKTNLRRLSTFTISFRVNS